MSFANPAYKIARPTVVGVEAMFAKMWDPPNASPATPELLAPTNPVPEVMAAAGYQKPPGTPHTIQRDLMHGVQIPTWDGQKNLLFFTIRDKDNPILDGNYPAGTIRMPRGVIFHAESQGHGPPPHTIHWHGIEPTPMNDGVGHCSFEFGFYTYQWQPNFIGTYFYHCHRNTMQHFEFGLFGMLLIEPPDAYFASIASTNPDGSVNLNGIPIGACRDGKRRTAANLAEFSQFPGFNGNPVDAADPLGQYPTDPHAMTVPYDVEALWVLDDRDSVWSDLAPDARATYPKHGDTPGVNDDFHGNAGGGVGSNDFFAFNDFNADYWFVTGVAVPAPKGGTAPIPSGIVIPPEFNSGVSGMQVSISAQVGQIILIRCLDAAYNCTEVTFPTDVVIIAWDGRALGVPPYGYNEAYLVPANNPIHMSTARRFDALIRATEPMTAFATVKFIDTRGQVPGFPETVVMTARIPINIGGTAAASATVSEARVTKNTDGSSTISITVEAPNAVTAHAIGDTQPLPGEPVAMTKDTVTGKFTCKVNIPAGATLPTNIVATADSGLVTQTTAAAPLTQTPTGGAGTGGTVLPTGVGDSGRSGGCFIATAAFGSSLEPEVGILREFRDTFLLTNGLGSRLVERYYRYSPPAADYISHHNSLKTGVRIMLYPAVGLSWMMISMKGFLNKMFSRENKCL